ncbi:hypothetical protein [Oceaniferula spumae]|uniref:hypothetical protein n=1 Tax=Oceaniferula spumae TaxID=2979115 RepID=UPI003F4ECC41
MIRITAESSLGRFLMARGKAGATAPNPFEGRILAAKKPAKSSNRNKTYHSFE